MPTPSNPPLRLLERPPSRRGVPVHARPSPAPWWTADGLRRVLRALQPRR